MNTESFKRDPDSDARDNQFLEADRVQQAEKAMREFNINAKQIKFGTPYSLSDLEVIFDTRFGKELRTRLTNRFQFVAKDDGTIVFTKERQGK
jgi:hypothetical protein